MGAARVGHGSWARALPSCGMQGDATAPFFVCLVDRSEASNGRQHLHEVERAGESGETPFIAILGLIVFLGSVFLVLLAISLLAYYLA